MNPFDQLFDDASAPAGVAALLPEPLPTSKPADSTGSSPTGAEPALSPDQDQALDQCLASLYEREETRLVGPAGSGKSFLMKRLIEATHWRPIYLACPTGKAARRLSQATGRLASTVHSMMFLRPDESAASGPAFTRKRKAPSSESFMVIDEASMVGSKLYKDLKLWLNPRTRIIYVGDREQLEPVKDTWGPDLAQPTAALTRVHRQALESPIIHLATSIRNDRADAALAYWAEAEDPRLMFGSNWLEWYLERRHLNDEVTLLTFTHDVRRYANSEIRLALGFRGVVAPGDRLLVRVNDAAQNLMNGDVLHVLSVETSRKNSDWLWVDVESLGEKRPSPLLVNKKLIEAEPKAFWDFRNKLNADDELLPFVHVWRGDCLTVHASQGSAWNEVGYLWCKSMTRMRAGRNAASARRLLYTAVTRASERLAILKA